MSELKLRPPTVVYETACRQARAVAIAIAIAIVIAGPLRAQNVPC